MAYDEVTAARVRRLLRRRKFRETQLMGGLCFMVGGSMCCSVSGKGGLLVRIDPAKSEKVLAEPHAAPMRMGNRTMRGFVRVEPEGFQADRALARWIELGLEAAAARSRDSGTEPRGKDRAPARAEPGNERACRYSFAACRGASAACEQALRPGSKRLAPGSNGSPTAPMGARCAARD